MKPIYVGLLGVGTVGGGTYTVLKRNQQEITRRTGRNIVIRMIADLDQEKVRHLTAGDDVIVTSDALEVARHPEIDIVIELMGDKPLPSRRSLKPSLMASMSLPPTRHCWQSMAMKSSQPHNSAMSSLRSKLPWQVAFPSSRPCVKVWQPTISNGSPASSMEPAISFCLKCVPKDWISLPFWLKHSNWAMPKLIRPMTSKASMQRIKLPSCSPCLRYPGPVRSNLHRGNYETGQ